MREILESFGRLSINITDQVAHRMQSMVMEFELRGANPLTLNSQVFGVYPIVFTPHDRQALFDLVGVTEPQIKRIIQSWDLFKGKNWEVAPDPFNQLSTWLIHLGLNQIKDKKKQHDFCLAVAKYMHYKFFTSMVHHRLQHGADEAVMLATINSLSRKFDLIDHGSWRVAITERCEDFISSGHDGNRKKSIHYDALVRGYTDEDIVQAIADVETRLRKRLNLICTVYYEFHKNDIRINSAAATTTSIDGEKILVERVSTFDSMITTITTELMNVNSFIDLPSLNAVSSQFTSASQTLLKTALTQLSELATRQQGLGLQHQPKNKVIDGETVIVGAREMVSDIIQVSFRFCENNNVSFKKQYRVWQALRNVYSSSRSDDADIRRVKASVEHFLDETFSIQRPATKSALRLSIIMYVVYRCLHYMR